MKKPPERRLKRRPPTAIDRRKGDEDIAERIAGGIRATVAPRHRTDDKAAPTTAKTRPPKL